MDTQRPKDGRAEIPADMKAALLGGISGTGKTFTLKRIRETLGFDFVDFQMVGN